MSFCFNIFCMFCFQFSVTFRFYNICIIIVPIRVIYLGTSRGSHLNLISLNKEKRSCFLEIKNISDETWKTVSINYLNWEANKEQIDSALKHSLNLPYLRKVQFIIKVYIRKVQTFKNCVSKRVVLKIMYSCKMKKKLWSNLFKLVMLETVCWLFQNNFSIYITSSIRRMGNKNGYTN